MKTHLITFALTGICTLFLPSENRIKKPLNTAVQQEVITDSSYKLYVGKYQMSPTRVLTITEADNKLFGEPTGEQKVELHPESEHVFTIKEFKGKVTFVVDAKGEVTQALINLQDKDVVAKKIEEK
jgi:hypothetical protein